MFDLLIDNATIIDGSGRRGQPGSVGVKGDKIVAVGRFDPGQAGVRIDAAGMVVAPGFVDPHSHSDCSIHSNREADSTIRQGVTTEIVGNCGMSNAPVSDLSRANIENRLRLYGYDLPAEWGSFGEYLDHVENRGVAVNLAWFVGHSAVRAAAGAFEGRPSDEQLSVMESYVEEAMLSGALGMSTGLEYGPGRFAEREELLRLGRVVGRHDGYYASHIRNRDATILSAVEEFLAIVEEGGLHGEISHLNVRSNTGAPSNAWAEAVEMMTAARARGLDVEADMTPFEEGLGIMSGLLPPWLLSEGPRRAAELLADRQVRERVREDSDRYWRFVRKGEWGRVRLLHSEQFPELDGLAFPEIAARRRTDEWGAFFDILSAAGEAMEHMLMIGRLFEPGDLAEQLRHPLFSCGVDACSSSTTERGGDMARTFLAFSGHVHYLSVHVRQRGTLSLEEMVRKMTSLPASRFGLRGRGRIEKGYYADLVVFDPAKVSSGSSFEQPAVYPVGVRAVIVNGQVTVENGEHSGVLAGRVLRRAA